MPAETLCVYQFKVVLRGISPMIWRRLLLRSDHSIADLHYTIQIAMGWSDSHLHRFHIHATPAGEPPRSLDENDPEQLRLMNPIFMSLKEWIIFSRR
jgi:Plasmid pRiA4b ORF-3-like protein